MVTQRSSYGAQASILHYGRGLRLLNNPDAGGPSWSAGILTRKMLVERSGFCGLEVRAPTHYSTTSASSLPAAPLDIYRMVGSY